MPIYEYYCPDNHRIYSFLARTLAQGRTIPKCPDNAAFRMKKILSPFAVTGRGRTAGDEGKAAGPAAGGESPAEDARMEAALSAMEGEFANVDENDPRAMGRMMRRMSELTGEKVDGDMEEVLRKLEEGADPDRLEAEMGGASGAGDEAEAGDPYGMAGAGDAKLPADPREPRHRFRARRGPPTRDPRLYDYE